MAYSIFSTTQNASRNEKNANMLRRKSEKKFFGLLIAGIIFIICKEYFIVDTPRLTNKLGDKTCGRFPKEEDILVESLVWQVLEMPSGFLYLFNAYLDDRLNKKTVRINTSGVKINITVDAIYCQFWFDEVSAPYTVKATEFILMWYWKVEHVASHPYLITCPFDLPGKTPSSVSLTANPCDDAENNLNIIDNRPADGVKKKFGVCSKQISYEDREYVVRLVEWVHMLRILGADKVYFYNRYVHPEFFRVLRYMEDKNFIKVWSYLEPRANEMHTTQAHLFDINLLNDCFYKIRNLYEFVVVLDTDEVIMPVMEEDRSWVDIVSRFDVTKQDAFCSENVYYPEVGAKPRGEIPEYHYMLQHIGRSVNFTKPGSRVKSILVPDEIIVVSIQYAFFCLNHSTEPSAEGTQQCRCWSMPTNVSQLSHYRNNIKEDEFKVTIEDKLIWRYKDDLIKAVQETLDATKFHV